MASITREDEQSEDESDGGDCSDNNELESEENLKTSRDYGLSLKWTIVFFSFLIVMNKLFIVMK